MTFNAFDFEREELLFCNLHYHQIKLVLVLVAFTKTTHSNEKNSCQYTLLHSNRNSERTKIAIKGGHCYLDTYILNVSISNWTLYPSLHSFVPTPSILVKVPYNIFSYTVSLGSHSRRSATKQMDWEIHWLSCHKKGGGQIIEVAMNFDSTYRMYEFQINLERDNLRC